MLYREISRVIGQYLFYFAILFFIPLCISIYYEFFASSVEHPQPHSSLAFFYSGAICLGMAFLFWKVGLSASGKLYRREALAIVAAIWFITAAVAGLPFYFSGTFEKPVDCYFEAMSGLTTTGASVMHPKSYDPDGKEVACLIKADWGEYDDYEFFGTIKPVRDITGKSIFTGIEAVGKAILFWRSFLQWLGGMGIVVLFIAILPALGMGGKVLYQAEVPGPMKDSVTPRIKETASILWKLYLGLTVLEIILLTTTNREISLFDAFTITFSNLSTGGFSVHNAGIAFYQNAITEWIIIVFMIVGSINFAIYFHCLKGKIYRIYEAEFITYLLFLFIVSCLVIYYLFGEKIVLLNDLGEKISCSFEGYIRYACFHLVSAQTSTGFATADYNIWPVPAQMIMLLVMFIGSMSGSTGGGIKVIRYYMLFFIAKNKIESIFRPETVRTLRIGKQEVDNNASTTVLTFFFIVVFLVVVATLMLTMDGVDPETAFSVNTCMINNIGIAFRAAAKAGSFAFLSSFGKILSSFLMLLGRLEFFALLILLVPAFWKEE